MISPKVLEEYVERVYGYAVRRTYTRDEADDLSQEILLTVLRKLPNIRDEQSFEPFLWGIAENVTKTFRRHQGRQRAMFVYDMPEELSLDDKYSVEDEEEAENLRRKIAMLSAIYRDIIVLYYYDGLSTKEIARRLGIPEGTVTWRLSAGREKLRKEINNMRESALKPNRSFYIGIYGSGEYDDEYGKPFPSEFISDALSKQIIWNCRETPQSVESLADTLGVPAYYIEDSIKNLLNRRAVIEQPQGKYLADIIILTDSAAEYDINSRELVRPIADRLIEALGTVADKAVELGHYTARKTKEQLIYAYSLKATRIAFSDISVDYPPIEPNYDGYRWRYIGRSENEKHYSGIGFHGVGGDGHLLGLSWTNWRAEGLFNFGIMPQVQWLDAARKLTVGAEQTNSEDFTKAIECGIIRKDENGSFYSNIPYLNREEYGRFCEIAHGALDPLRESVAEISKKYADGYIRLFPKHLNKDAMRFAHEFTSRSMLDHVFKIAIESGAMTPPPKEDFYCEIMNEG